MGYNDRQNGNGYQKSKTYEKPNNGGYNNNNGGSNNSKRDEERGAIWGPYKSKNGMEYFKLEINGEKLIAFPNKKGKDAHPDFRVYAQKPSTGGGNGNGNGGYSKPDNGGYQKQNDNNNNNYTQPSYDVGSSVEEDEIPNF